jgi:hypothetical protein
MPASRFQDFSNEEIAFLWSATANLYNRVLKHVGNQEIGPTVKAGGELCRILGREVEQRQVEGTWYHDDLSKPMDVVQ